MIIRIITSHIKFSQSCCTDCRSVMLIYVWWRSSLTKKTDTPYCKYCVKGTSIIEWFLIVHMRWRRLFTFHKDRYDYIMKFWKMEDPRMIDTAINEGLTSFWFFSLISKSSFTTSTGHYLELLMAARRRKKLPSPIWRKSVTGERFASPLCYRRRETPASFNRLPLPFNLQITATREHLYQTILA